MARGSGVGKTNRIGGIGMIAQWLTGESRQVIRHRRGVVWCPFCDRSRMDTGPEMVCDGCNAVFKDDAAEPIQESPPRRGRRATNGDTEATSGDNASTEETPEEPAEEVSEEPTDPDPE